MTPSVTHLPYGNPAANGLDFPASGEAGMTKRRELCPESRFAPSKRTPSFFSAEDLKPRPFLAQAQNTPELPDYCRFVIPGRSSCRAASLLRALHRSLLPNKNAGDGLQREPAFSGSAGLALGWSNGGKDTGRQNEMIPISPF